MRSKVSIVFFHECSTACSNISPVKAIETIDQCLARLADATKKTNSAMLITADHGNAEQMRNPQTQQPHTAHTHNPVPLVYIGKNARFKKTLGVIYDIAPTFLSLLGITPPDEMTGEILLQAVEHS